MRTELEKYLIAEAEKHIKRHMSRQRGAAAVRAQYRRRTGKTPGVPAKSTPRYWELDQQFNPFYVRSHAESIAHALTAKIKAGDYEPRPSIKVQVPKTTGGTRGINIFTVTTVQDILKFVVLDK